MSSQQDPMLWLGYTQTGGYVLRPASKERALREVASGVLSERQQRISVALRAARLDGMTYQEVGRALELHHGQSSGALSNMHKAGVVFMLRTQRNGCHPYVHVDYRDNFADDFCWDEPVRTRNSKRNELMGELLNVCRVAADVGWSVAMQNEATSLVDMIDKYDNSRSTEQ
jgi:hypothetical protein